MNGAQALETPLPIPASDESGAARYPAARMMTIAALAALTVFGFVARLVLSWISLGSNDYHTWSWFGNLVVLTGPFRAYELDPQLNHPPIALLWAGLATFISCLTNISFPFLFRLAPIAADIGSSVVLYRIFSARRGDARWGLLASAAYAWNLNALMVGAYHCNTDNICAFFTLLSAYRLADRKSPFTAGIALAAAINIKIVPLLLIPALLAACGTRRSATRFVAGLLVGVPPFLLMLAVIPQTFAHNVFGYNSMVGNWGLMFFIMNAQYLPSIASRAAFWTAWYAVSGKYVLLAAVTLLGILAAWLRRWNTYELGALAWAIFLAITPGFGVQYTVFVAPLLMAACLRTGALYGLISGLFVLVAYGRFWTGELPLQSIFDGTENPLMTPLALVAWAILVAFIGRTLWRNAPKSAARCFA